MNKQVSHIGIAALVLLAALIVATTYWQTWANAGLANRQDNEIQLVAQFTIKRGKIYASDGRTLLATNVTKKVGGQTLYFRRYPTGPLFSDVVGYSTQIAEPNGPRAVVQRLSHRLERQPRHGLSLRARQAERHDGHRERPRADDPARGAGTRIATPARQVRSRRRAGSDDGPRARDGNEPDLQPEPGREALRPRDANEPSVRRSASEPRDRR